MTKVLGWIAAKFGAWTIITLAGVCFALGTSLMVQGCQVKNLKEKVTTVEGERDVAQQLADDRADKIDELEAANRQVNVVVDDLAQRLEAEARSKQDVEAALARARVALDAKQRALDSALDHLARAKESIYATDSTCADWADRPVCGAITERVLDQYEALRSGRGPAADRRAPDRAGAAGSGHDRAPGAAAGPQAGRAVWPAWVRPPGRVPEQPPARRTG